MTLDEFTRLNKAEGRRSKISQFHTEVLKLRELGYSLIQIAQFLATNGVEVTAPAISQYIKAHARDPKFMYASSLPSNSSESLLVAERSEPDALSRRKIAQVNTDKYS